MVPSNTPPGAPPSAPPGSPPGKKFSKTKLIGLVSVPIPVLGRRRAAPPAEPVAPKPPPAEDPTQVPQPLPVPTPARAPTDFQEPNASNGVPEEDATLSELDLPELEKMEELPVLPSITDSSEDPTHVDLGAKPPTQAEEISKKPEHPELKYKAPDIPVTSRLKLNLPPIPRAKLDGYGMFAAMACLLALMTSPVFLDFLSESPLAHFSDPGVELTISVFPRSSLPTGVWISGYRVPFDHEATVHVPYGGPYRLQVQREGFQDYTSEISFQPQKEKKELDDRQLSVDLVPSPYGLLNVGSSRPCLVNVGDGVTTWHLTTPIRELKVPPADYLVKFDDPKCMDKQFYMPVREGSRSYVVYEFPTDSKDSGYLPSTAPKREPAGGTPPGQ